MGKTDSSESGTVLLLDPPDVVRKKFKTAVTDSGTEVRHDREEKPGVSNLIEIMAVATGQSIAEVEAQFDGQGYGAFKEAVGRGRRRALRADPAPLRGAARGRGRAPAAPAQGAEKARETSAPKVEAMYERMGFVRP